MDDAQIKEQAAGLTEAPLDLIRRILDKHHQALCEELRDQVRKMMNERNHFRDLYSELLYAVERKHPGESRHQTALRYIRSCEQPNGGQAQESRGDTDDKR